MEPLTHTLVGAVLARTRIARDVPRAGLTLVVAANLPDLDVLAHFAGQDAASGFRRGWTHGPVGVLVLPALWFLVVRAIDRRRRRDAQPRASALALLGLSYLGCLTHPFLDWLNTYGVRLLMPFDDRWFYGDAVFIVDPWLWLVLGGAVYATSTRRGVPWGWLALGAATSSIVFLARDMIPPAAQAVWFLGLAGAALFGRASWPAKDPARVATLALAIAALYIGAMTASSAIGEKWVRSEIERRGIGGVSRLMVGPLPADPFHWDVVAETPGAYHVGTLSWLPRTSLDLDGPPIERTRPSPIVDAALAAPHIQGTLGWMRFPFVEVETLPEGYIVHFLDARYVRSRRTGFGTVQVALDRELRVLPPVR